MEITGAYYDAHHGAFLWKYAGGAPNAPTHWSGVNPDQSLAEAVVDCIRAKSAKRYGANTLLLVNIPPGVTSFEELTRRLTGKQLADMSALDGVYVCGTFPITSKSNGGYRVISMKEVS